MKRHLRRIVQLASAALLNGYAVGFAGGKIYNGPLKAVCVPVLNCYACPGALGACPVGSLQHVLGGAKNRFSFYVLGMLTLFGVTLGRLWCGFVCPFGFIQDLFGKIPVRHFTVPQKIDRPARFVKYAILAVFVILLPIVAKNQYGIADSWFCKYICPAGTLEGGIPLLIANKTLRALAGFLFSWKMAVLVIILAASVFIPRFFCRYLCPLGAFYGLFNRFSLYQLILDQTRCDGCGACKSACPMAVDLPTAGSDSRVKKRQPEGCHIAQITSAECIRCGQCKSTCPHGAIGSGAGFAVAEDKLGRDRAAGKQ